MWRGMKNGLLKEVKGRDEREPGRKVVRERERRVF